MLNRTGTALCGNSSRGRPQRLRRFVEFKTKALEIVPESPDAATQDCACAVEIMDKELDDKTKKIFLIMADPELQKDEAKARRRAQAAGYKEGDLMAIVPAIMPIMGVRRVPEPCKTSVLPGYANRPPGNRRPSSFAVPAGA